MRTTYYITTEMTKQRFEIKPKMNRYIVKYTIQIQYSYKTIFNWLQGTTTSIVAFAIETIEWRRSNREQKYFDIRLLEHNI